MPEHRFRFGGLSLCEKLKSFSAGFPIKLEKVERGLAVSKPISSFNRMKIAAPCDADWESMAGNDQVRFCEHCNLHVTDLSSLSRRDAMELVARSQGRICVRFIPTPSGGVLTRTLPEKLYRIQRRVSRIAASAFTATLSISSAMAQSPGSSSSDQVTEAVQRVQTEGRREITDQFKAGIEGVVRTEENSRISNATVVLVDRETGEERTAISSGFGRYVFESLPEGDYMLWARKPGLRTSRETINVPSNTTIHTELVMHEPAMLFGETMGAMSIVAEPEDLLFKAISENDVASVQQMVVADSQLNRADRRYGMSLLTQAVKNGNREIVSTLLTFGADVNLRDGNQRTPLMYLSEKATPELLRDLLSMGARLNARDEYGASVLMNAAEYNPPRILRDMIEAGAQVNSRDSSGENCLFRAARTNTAESIILLLEAGADMEVRNEDGETALMSMAASGNLANFQTLIARGADRNVRAEDGRTLLMFTAVNEDPRLAKSLVESGEDVNAKDLEGNTALMYAAMTGHSETVALLCLAGADPDKKNSDGETALMKAVSANDLECVQELLKAGADVRKKNPEGKTALALARESEHDEIIELLKSRGAP